MKSTEQLKNVLKKSYDIDEYLDNNQEDLCPQSFVDMMNAFMLERDISRADLIRKTNIYVRYGYEVLDGQKKPARDKVIQLSLALGLSVEETNHLLNASGNNELYARSVRDSIIMYSLANGLSVVDCNEELYAHEMDILE